MKEYKHNMLKKLKINRNISYFTFVILLSLIFYTKPANAKINTVAISYFDNTSKDQELNPLSKGLADMMITDLSNVKSLKIVEREKLEKLLKEIKLDESKFIDQKTAQKLGKG
ncbi:MAG: hypothetical protein H7263_00835, partial [Candidatus Sericytochromatia bacterium]|nr:hypothetical protein [Candidatus Sericytochromatia bacterium]